MEVIEGRTQEGQAEQREKHHLKGEESVRDVHECGGPAYGSSGPGQNHAESERVDAADEVCCAESKVLEELQLGPPETTGWTVPIIRLCRFPQRVRDDYRN